MMTKKGWSRRGFLGGMSLLAAGGAASLLDPKRPWAQIQEDKTRFLIVLGASGGASIIDSLLAIRASETSQAATLNCFADEHVQSFEGSPLRAVDLERGALGAIPQAFTAKQSDFVRANRQDIAVITTETTSVNHAVGQRRSITGNEAWSGRTLQELVAMEYGAGFALPNVHLSQGTGFTERGTDASLPTWTFGEPISDPALWPLSLDGLKGLKRNLDRGLVDRARRFRNQKLDPDSRFARVFGEAPRLQHWDHLRADAQAQIEGQDLISKLMLFPDSARTPLSAYGLQSSPDGQKVREAFPRYDVDPFQAQAALAFLLIKNRVSVTVTIDPSFNVVVNGDQEIDLRGGAQGGLPPETILNPPIAFDFSHQGHRSVQAMMWSRVYQVADGLIRLLKAEEYANGESFWDRTMIYLATDFGRSKTRPADSDEFGTGHHLNNGVAVISPLVKGDTVLGGVDPQTGLTYGFDPQTGAPDQGRRTEEREVFGGLLGALGVNTEGSGLPDVPALRRG
jgi:hypothetical protein